MSRTFFIVSGFVTGLILAAASGTTAQTSLELATREQVPPGLVAPTHAPPAPIPRLTSCDAQLWLTRPPPMTEDLVYGVGSGASMEAAMNNARAAAAKSIEVEVREEITDTQTLWIDRASGDKARERSREKVSRAVSSHVDRRLNSCAQEQRCTNGSGSTFVLVSCARKSELERRLAQAAAKLSAVPLPSISVLPVPGINEEGHVTQLGEYMSRVLRDALTNGQAAGANQLQIVSAPPWRTAELAEAARASRASHLLRVEHLTLDERRIRVSAYLQEAATDHYVPNSVVAFEAQLDPAQLTLLAVRGPLLPQKNAHDFVNTTGTMPVPLRLSKTDLREGEEVTISVTLPIEGYLYIYDIYEDGQAVLLVPSVLNPNNHFPAQTQFELPDAAWRSAGATLTACPLNNQAITRESVKAIVSPVPLDLPGTRASADGLTTLSMSTGGRSATLAAVRQRIEALKAQGVAIGTSDMQYYVRAAKQRSSACAR